MQEPQPGRRYDYVSIKIKPETYQLLVELKARMIKMAMKQDRRGRRITEDYVIREALELLKSRLEEVEG